MINSQSAEHEDVTNVADRRKDKGIDGSDKKARKKT
jgi:hypothetical protein